MKTILLGLEQQAVFSCFSRQPLDPKREAAIQIENKEKKGKEHDKDYDFFHERMNSNLCRLATPSDEQFETIKEFLLTPANLLVENFSERQMLKYTHILSVADMLATDWVYFPKSCMRRTMLKLFHDILGCELNFVLCLTEEQKVQLNN